jgi:hypothetical protein
MDDDDDDEILHSIVLGDKRVIEAVVVSRHPTLSVALASFGSRC